MRNLVQFFVAIGMLALILMVTRCGSDDVAPTTTKEVAASGSAASEGNKASSDEKPKAPDMMAKGKGKLGDAKAKVDDDAADSDLDDKD